MTIRRSRRRRSIDINSTTEDLGGPPVYENWRAALRGEASRGAYEVPLFTDAHVVGHLAEGYGPYQLLNPIGIRTSHPDVPPAIVLRIESHIPPDLDAQLSADAPTDDEKYHGGILNDEVAALASLALGIRLKAGGATREFDPDEDPRGRPIAYYHWQNPILLPSIHTPVLPWTVGRHDLDDAAPLKNLPILSAKDAIELVQAARLYQDALWIAESSPALTWLLLVSALETAANRWRQSEDTPIERLQASRPNFLAVLQEAGGEQLVETVAPMIAPYMGATKKFIDFVLEFLPEPPATRPTVEWAQVSWNPRDMKNAMRKIYEYRSKALHGSGRIPAPMCMPPMSATPGNLPEERPLWRSAQVMGGTWQTKDIPMLLHVFEYVTRGVLLNWWKSLPISDSASRTT